MKNNREVVLAAVQNDGGALKYASEQMNNNQEVVLAPVRDGHWNMLARSLS